MSQQNYPEQGAQSTEEGVEDDRHVRDLISFLDEEERKESLQVEAELERNKQSCALLPQALLERQSLTARRSIYVANLAPTLNKLSLETLFRHCGEVHRVTVIADKKRRGQGYAFLDFKNEESVQLALEMNGIIFQGRRIKVKRRYPPKMTSTHP